MSGLIPRNFIDQVLAMTDIVQLIDERLPLKKTGKHFSACCPFHTEKTPSFSVNPVQQFYHCFGCGVSGNAISFLMEFDRLDFVSCIDYLARQHGLSLPVEEKTAGEKVTKSPTLKTDAYDLLMHVAILYQKQLKDTPAAIEYLKKRAFSGDIVKHYGIGFAPDQWHFLSEQLPQSEAVLLETGMLITGDKNRPYDRFRQRIMFPIRDLRGRVIAFGGRVIFDEQPKYLNSPETAYFYKGRELYGLYEARMANRDLPELLVVEGYFDVVALAQYGISNAVATLGTATSTDHIEKMNRFTTSIVFCFDGDKAGRQAAWRALNNALPALRDTVGIKFLFLPEGVDPDSYVRKVGADVFRQAIAAAIPLSHFLFNHLRRDCALTTAEGKAKLIDKAMVLLRQIPRSNLRNLLIDELAQLSKLPRGDLIRLLTSKALPEDSVHQPPVALNQIKAHQLVQSPMRAAIHLLLIHPALIKQLTAADITRLQQLTLPGADLLQSLFMRIQAQPTLVLASLIESYRNQAEFAILLKLTQQNSLDMTEAAMHNEWRAVISKLFRLEQDQHIQRLHHLMRERELTSTEKNQLLSLLKG